MFLNLRPKPEEHDLVLHGVSKLTKPTKIDVIN